MMVAASEPSACLRPHSFVQPAIVPAFAGDRSPGSIAGPLTPSRRVVRGGSWNNNPQNLRSANRNRVRPVRHRFEGGLNAPRTGTTTTGSVWPASSSMGQSRLKSTDRRESPECVQDVA